MSKFFFYSEDICKYLDVKTNLDIMYRFVNFFCHIKKSHCHVCAHVSGFSLLLLKGKKGRNVLVSFYINLTQARIISEEIVVSIEKMPQ